MEPRKKSDFSTGKISSTILRLAAPMVAAEFVHILYNLIDRMYIGHMSEGGTEALTGMGLVLPLITLIGAFANICTTGGASLCAIARGEKDEKKAVGIQETSFSLLLVFGIVLTVLFAFFRRPLLLLLGADEQTLPFAMGYFSYYLIGTTFSMISLGMNAFINVQGFPGIGMGTVIIGAVTNIVLDPIFIFSFGLGIKGAALATVVSQMVSSIWVVAFFFGKKAILPIYRFRMKSEYVKQIFSLGASGFCFKMTNSITQMVVNITLNKWGGALSTLYIGSMSIINSLREVLYLPVFGITDAAKPVMSYNYGAKEYERVSKSIRFITGVCLVLNTASYLLVNLFPRVMIGIFSSDPALISTCIPCLHHYYAAFFMMSFHTAGQAVFVALNKPKHAVFFALFRKMILILPFTLILPRLGLAADGVFWAEAISDVFGGSASFITMILTMKKSGIRVFFHHKKRKLPLQKSVE